MLPLSFVGSLNARASLASSRGNVPSKQVLPITSLKDKLEIASMQNYCNSTTPKYEKVKSNHKDFDHIRCNNVFFKNTAARKTAHLLQGPGVGFGF